LWRSLQTELAAQLAARSTSALQDITDPDLRVTDFDATTVEISGKTLTFTWSYKLTGDYDGNGQVNASDLAPIAKYFHLTPASPFWDQAKFADGDGNGEINASDISTIASNFGNEVHGFILGAELQDYDQNSAVNISDLTSMAAKMPRENLGTKVPGVLFLRSGSTHLTDFGPVRASDSELPYIYFGMYAFPMQLGERGTDGRLHFTAELGYISTMHSTYYTLVPYRSSVDNIYVWDLGQLSDEVLYVSDYPP